MTRSNAYVMTAHVGSVGDMLELETIRKTVKIINKKAKENDRINKNRYIHGWTDVEPRLTTKYRVNIMPRGPRAIHAIADGRSPRAYDSTLPIRHAERLDVYIHERSNYEGYC
jgi:hypothetical protein|tara:strand:+ start:195 stop:533 length:339 start_codon:yes stop_codon:yes gene_type:complete